MYILLKLLYYASRRPACRMSFEGMKNGLQLLFFSSILLPLAQHPLHFYLGFFHKLIAPLGGHDGFAEPGGDGYFHFLHHKHFEVNYGSPTVPLDKLFGSFSDGSKLQKQ